MHRLISILFTIWLFRFVLVSATPNLNITNGTCYYAPGKEAPSRFIPCGNDAVGRQTCCESLDMCLSNQACFNGQFYVTYLAGCTDPEYEDSSCPDKGGYADNSWAGLVYCNGSSSEWMACPDGGNTVSVPEPCYCPSTSHPIAFSAPATLSSSMSLPASLGESVSWMACHGPYDCGGTAITIPSSSSITPIPAFSSSLSSSSATVSAGNSSVAISTQLTSTAMPASDSGQTSTPSSTGPLTSSSSPTTEGSRKSTGLSTGAKAGIGIGASVAAVGALALLAAACLSSARKRRKDVQALPSVEDQIRKRSPVTSPVASEMDSTAARPWSLRSELPATQSVPQSPPADVRPTYQSIKEENSGTVSSIDHTIADDSPSRGPGVGQVHEMPG